MKVLVIGSGGREHALAWTMARQTNVDQVFVAPGNAGTATETKCVNVDIAVNDFSSQVELVQRHDIDLTVVGPEDPLVNGIRDFFDEAELACFAPSKVAAQIEGSKHFAKSFMRRHGIPTADFIATSNLGEATDYIRSNGAPIVVKANGLAAGKGVVVAQTTEEAIQAATSMLDGQKFGTAGEELVIEQYLEGEEASYIVMSDGKVAVPFASSQDHKPLLDGGRGPNTGGMGAYSPAPVVDEDVERKIMAQVIQPAIDGMVKEGMPFQGFLYAGLMISPDQNVHVVEFNCRFGDPEAQPVLYRLKSNLADLCLAATKGQLAGQQLEFSKQAAVGVVCASGGYPAKYETGFKISGLDQLPASAKAFHAGTQLNANQITTSGGRVLCVVGSDGDFLQAQKLAYEGVEAIDFHACHYRRDIGYRVLERLAQ